MRVVIDTNVLVSAALRNRDPEECVVFAATEPGVAWVVTASILAEYRAVLARPRLGLPPDVLARWTNVFAGATAIIPEPAPPADLVPRDASDSKFIAAASNGQADVLVTGDRDFASARLPSGLLVVSPGVFRRVVIAQYRHERPST